MYRRFEGALVFPFSSCYTLARNNLKVLVKEAGETFLLALLCCCVEAIVLGVWHILFASRYSVADLGL